MWIIRVEVCSEVFPEIRLNSRLLYLIVLKDKFRSMIGIEFHPAAADSIEIKMMFFVVDIIIMS